MLKVGMEVQLRKADLKRALKVLKELRAKMAKIEAGEDGDLLVRAWGVKDNYVALSAPAYVGGVGSAVVDVKMFENAVNSAGKDISLLSANALPNFPSKTAPFVFELPPSPYAILPLLPTAISLFYLPPTPLPSHQELGKQLLHLFLRRR